MNNIAPIFDFDAYNASIIDQGFLAWERRRNIRVADPDLSIKEQLVEKGVGAVIMTSHTITATPDRAMRVRGGKQGKVKTSLDMIAKAHPIYENYGVSAIVSDVTQFKAFDKRKDKFTGYWEPTKTLAPVKRVMRVESRGVFSDDVVADVNTLLRNVLLFKGITYQMIDVDLRTFSRRRDSKIAKIDDLIAQLEQRRHLLDKASITHSSDICAINDHERQLRHIKGYWSHVKPYVLYVPNTMVELDLSLTNNKYAAFKDKEKSWKIAMGVIRTLHINDVKVVRCVKNFHTQALIPLHQYFRPDNRPLNFDYHILFDKSSCAYIQKWMEDIRVNS